ncbi:MAG UNVERIFIED_CONTAM: hypothetical protein LVR18_22110 [Planctomycetaceae bacterium]|jgi:hypothetical protein
MDGILRSTADRVLLNAVTRVEVTGPVLAASDLLLHAGVAADWTLDVLEGDSIQHSDLSGGDVLIIGAGSLQSDGALRLLAGGNVDIQSDATAGGLTTRSRPITTTVPQTVYVVTGYNQVATGTITRARSPHHLDPGHTSGRHG